LARAIVHDRQAAEDVLQDTFLAAFRSAGSYRHEASVASWLYAIARHSAYRRTTRSRREVTADDRAIERLGVEAGWGRDDVEVAASRAELRAQLAAALGELDPEEREILALRDGLGLSGEETAAALGTTVAAMKSRLHRARLRLAGRLRGGYHGDD
jgi:RNA polymerase sigma-70 factor (ECF subfamily)